ncbi:MAG TPA: hypothetical protein VFH85_08525 [Gammaproteobacteria bacterium]|nr:hypothetical protein [Gammaproteobacteria bacterium]
MEWKGDDRIPVLTDIVDPSRADEAEPYLPEEQDEAPTEQPRVGFDDNFGVDEAEAAGMSTLLGPEPAQQGVPARDLDELRATLTAELDHAAARIVEDSVVGLEAQLTASIAERLKEEVRGIVGAAIKDFERQQKH